METKEMVKYANSVSVSYSPFEMRLEFYVETPVEGKNEVQRELVGDIRITPQLAKELQGIITSCVEDYEKSVGEIPVISRKEN